MFDCCNWIVISARCCSLLFKRKRNICYAIHSKEERMATSEISSFVALFLLETCWVVDSSVKRNLDIIWPLLECIRLPRWLLAS